VQALHPFDNAEVAFCTRAECLKSLFVSLAFVGGQRGFITIKFDNDRPLWQSCFVRELKPLLRSSQLLLFVRSVRPLRPGLRTELANQHIVPEQKHIRLEPDVLTIRLSCIDQNVDLVAVLDFAA
jgi:hypothetical protein